MEYWIARSLKGNLCLYEKKPIKKDGKIMGDISGDYYFIDEDLFPEVTFENYPRKVELKLAKE